jgi:hypothetical protein
MNQNLKGYGASFGVVSWKFAASVYGQAFLYSKSSILSQLIEV